MSQASLFQHRLFSLGILSCFVVLSVDQASKWFMTTVVMNPPRIIPVTSFFNLVLLFNPGVSFGLLADLGTWGPGILSFMSIVIIGLLLGWLCRIEKASEAVPIGMIIGGAFGNLADRLRTGAVTDFLDFYIGQYHWPAFNLADTGIVLGVSFLGVRALRSP